MTLAAPLPRPSPLPDEHGELLQRLVDGLEPSALYWLSGYAAGLAASRASQVSRPLQAVAVAQADVTARLTIVYGSQTGNAKRAAEQIAREAEDVGLVVRLLRADVYPLRELKDEQLLYIVISTQGDGDPPDDAHAFVDFIAGRRAPELKSLRYAVLALGDSSYPKFCAIGRQLDARLAELGATRALDLAEADLDIERIAVPWRATALVRAREALIPAGTTARATVTPLRPPPSAAYSKDRPLAAELLLNQRITGRDSTRDVRHIELSLEDSGLSYEPGDSLGVWPRNPPALVDGVLAQLDLDGDCIVEHEGQSLRLRAWLSERRELTRLSRPFVAALAARAGDEKLNRVLNPDQTAALAQLFAQQQPIDLLRAHPAAWNAEDLVAALRPLTPRLYSIASSRKRVGDDEVHLTVSHVEYARGEELRWGAASHFLAARTIGESIPVFIEANERFRLPDDPARDMIMIGPGTGIAPFRAFTQERAETGATGRHWLFFGNPHFRSDFLYQVEWQQSLRDGTLDRIDLAFSRDHAKKSYVQHRLSERGRDVYDWLENGAHLYVCGATAMARDVHDALKSIIASHGGRDANAADDYLNDLQRAGRYARDTY